MSSCYFYLRSFSRILAIISIVWCSFVCFAQYFRRSADFITSEVCWFISIQYLNTSCLTQMNILSCNHFTMFGLPFYCRFFRTVYLSVVCLCLVRFVSFPYFALYLHFPCSLISCTMHMYMMHLVFRCHQQLNGSTLCTFIFRLVFSPLPWYAYTHFLHFIRQFAAILFFFHVSFFVFVFFFRFDLSTCTHSKWWLKVGEYKNTRTQSTTLPPAYIHKQSAHMNFISFAYSLDVHNLLDAIIMYHKKRIETSNEKMGMECSGKSSFRFESIEISLSKHTHIHTQTHRTIEWMEINTKLMIECWWCTNCLALFLHCTMHIAQVHSYMQICSNTHTDTPTSIKWNEKSNPSIIISGIAKSNHLDTLQYQITKQWLQSRSLWEWIDNRKRISKFFHFHFWVERERENERGFNLNVSFASSISLLSTPKKITSLCEYQANISN